jgi:methylated-DNA-[protein]-cysteine S-methyltransferase
MLWSAVASPMGALGVGVYGGVVRAVRFDGAPTGSGHEPTAPAVEVDEADAVVLAEAVAQLRAYLAGELTDFALPAAPGAGVDFEQGSDFERAVWARIAQIPYGETASYGEIARAVGTPAGAPTGPGQLARGVGTACNRNPTPVIVACHRVIGADGKLVGFGGGLHRKRFLLALEARVHIERSFAL